MHQSTSADIVFVEKKLSGVPSGESAAANFEEVVKEKERWWEGRCWRKEKERWWEGREKRWEGKNEEDGEIDKNDLGVGLFE